MVFIMTADFSKLMADFADRPAGYNLDVVNKQLQIVKGEPARIDTVINTLLEQAQISGNLPDATAKGNLYAVANRIVSDPNKLAPAVKGALDKIKKIAWPNRKDDSKHAEGSKDKAGGVSSSSSLPSTTAAGVGVLSSPQQQGTSAGLSALKEPPRASPGVVVPLDADLPPMSSPKHVGSAGVQGPLAAPLQKDAKDPIAMVTLKFKPAVQGGAPEVHEISVDDLKKLSVFFRDTVKGVENEAMAIQDLANASTILPQYTRAQFLILIGKNPLPLEKVKIDDLKKIFELAGYLGIDVSELCREILLGKMDKPHIPRFCLAWAHLPNSPANAKLKEEAGGLLSTFLLDTLIFQKKTAVEMKTELEELSKLKGLRITIRIPGPNEGVDCDDKDVGNFCTALRKLGSIAVVLDSFIPLTMWLTDFLHGRITTWLIHFLRCPNINSLGLTWYGFAPSKWCELIGKMRLKKLDLSGLLTRDEDLFNLSKIASLETLMVRTVSNTGMVHIAQFHWLKHLKIFYADALTEDCIPCLKQLTELETLTLVNPGSELISFLITLPLEVLTLYSESFPEKRVFSPTLKVLTLGGTLTEESCIAALKCPQLKSLTIKRHKEGTPRITGKGLLQAVSAKLNRMEFNDCPQLEGDNLVAFYQKWAETHPKLKPPSLQFYKCPNCTEDHLDRIRSLFTGFNLDKSHFSMGYFPPYAH